uniref:Protein kinase domain-containing protein n=1 Tax=Alexandrium monilatum TaxID=311494 RepID=A0A7S4SAQ9_9DINO
MGYQSLQKRSFPVPQRRRNRGGMGRTCHEGSSSSEEERLRQKCKSAGPVPPGSLPQGSSSSEEERLRQQCSIAGPVPPGSSPQGSSSSEEERLRQKCSIAGPVPPGSSPQGSSSSEEERLHQKCSSAGPAPPGLLPQAAPSPQTTRLSSAYVERSAERLSQGVKRWEDGNFRFVRTLQTAHRNHGRVDVLYHSARGCEVASKRMPNRWIATNPSGFQAAHPTESEQPWFDLGVQQALRDMKFPYVCRLLGIFRDCKYTYVLTSLAKTGDLFTWSLEAPDPGHEREALMMPLAGQLCHAVSWLHELGIAHRDLSLENVLLTEHGTDRLPRIQVIDFGAATLARSCRSEVRGKPSYQAPEMHEELDYDPFLADAFSLGVALYCMAAQGYPWAATKVGSCQLFDYCRTWGVRMFLQQRTVGTVLGAPKVGEVLSPGFLVLLEALLQPGHRSRGFLTRGRRCIWGLPWLQVAIHGDAKAYCSL